MEGKKQALIDLFTSSRFIGVLIVGLLQALLLFNLITNTQMEGLVQIIQTIIGAAVAIRTMDRNFGDAAKA